jgi:hypothetical protein
VPLDDEADGIEHVFASSLDTALKERTPFLRGEWLLASRTWFSDVAAMLADDAVACPAAHDGNRHPTWNEFAARS